MGSVKVACAVVGTLIPFIVLIILLDQVVIPNYHGSRFKIGKCQLETSYVNLNDVPWKDCSCGVTCTAQFPCVTLSGYYTPFGEGRDTRRNGSFHADYYAVKKQCFIIPNCVPDPTMNMVTVSKNIKQIFKYQNESPSFKCWALGDEILTVNYYSAKRASLALFLPLIFFTIGFIFLMASSKKIRRIFDECWCHLLPGCCQKICSCIGYVCDGCQAQADNEDRIFPMRTRVSDLRAPLPSTHPAPFSSQVAPLPGQVGPYPGQSVNFPAAALPDNLRSPPVYVEDEAPPPYSAE